MSFLEAKLTPKSAGVNFVTRESIRLALLDYFFQPPPRPLALRFSEAPLRGGELCATTPERQVLLLWRSPRQGEVGVIFFPPLQ